MKYGFALTILVLLAGCGATSTGQAVALPPLHGTYNSGDEALVDSVVWLRDNTLVVTAGAQLWFAQPGAQAWSTPPTTNPNCMAYHQLQVLPDGRLGVLCTLAATAERGQYGLFAYDRVTQRWTALLQAPLPATGTFSWSPDMQRGIFAKFGSFSTLLWLGTAAPEPITLTLTAGSKRWYLPDSLTAEGPYWDALAQQKPEPFPVGEAQAPAWAPDGHTIAFWATLQTIGQVNMPVLTWTLYLLNPQTLVTTAALSRTAEPTRLYWSPDSRRLLYMGGTPQLTGATEVWLLDTTNGTTTRLASGQISDGTWSPDGRDVVLLECPPTSRGRCPDPVFRRYTVASMGVATH